MNDSIEIDIPCDPRQIEDTGHPWEFLDEAPPSDRIRPGAIVITGDATDPVSLESFRSPTGPAA